MPIYATVLTTNTWDHFVVGQFDRTKANVRSGDMFVLANETDGPLNIPEAYRPLSISEAKVKELGLPIVYDKTLFCHNLDYLYIFFYVNNPVYDYYVFLDYPVLVKIDVDALVERASCDGVGLIAQPIDVTLETWVYTKPHASVYETAALQGALLPMVVLSNAALACLVRRRLDLAQHYARQPDFFWPFCEAFVPTELKLAGFKASPLSDYGSVDLYSWWPPTLDSALPVARQEGFVHPFLDERRYIRTLLQHTKTRDLFGGTVVKTLSANVPFRSYIGPLLAETLRRLLRLIRLGMPVERHNGSTPLWKADQRREGLTTP
jgi:hypothetical protein